MKKLSTPPLSKGKSMPYGTPSHTIQQADTDYSASSSFQSWTPPKALDAFRDPDGITLRFSASGRLQLAKVLPGGDLKPVGRAKLAKAPLHGVDYDKGWKIERDLSKEQVRIILRDHLRSAARVRAREAQDRDADYEWIDQMDEQPMFRKNLKTNSYDIKYTRAYFNLPLQLGPWHFKKRTSHAGIEIGGVSVHAGVFHGMVHLLITGEPRGEDFMARCIANPEGRMAGYGITGHHPIREYAMFEQVPVSLDRHHDEEVLLNVIVDALYHPEMMRVWGKNLYSMTSSCFHLVDRITSDLEDKHFGQNMTMEVKRRQKKMLKFAIPLLRIGYHVRKALGIELFQDHDVMSRNRGHMRETLTPEQISLLKNYESRLLDDKLN